MDNLKDLTIQQLRLYKHDLIGKIKELQKKTREVDKIIKQKLIVNQ